MQNRVNQFLMFGSGPGHQILEISAVVGDDGHVIGIDPAEDGIEIARQRCSGADNIEFRIGSVVDLPFDNDTFDAAMSSQVFEYLDDVAGALKEMQGIKIWRSGTDSRYRLGIVVVAFLGHRAHERNPDVLGRPSCRPSLTPNPSSPFAIRRVFEYSD